MKFTKLKKRSEDGEKERKAENRPTNPTEIFGTTSWNDDGEKSSLCYACSEKA